MKRQWKRSLYKKQKEEDKERCREAVGSFENSEESIETTDNKIPSLSEDGTIKGWSVVMDKYLHVFKIQ